MKLIKIFWLKLNKRKELLCSVLNFLKNWVKSLDARIIDIENKMWNTVPNHYHCKICECVLKSDSYIFQPKKPEFVKVVLLKKVKKRLEKK